MRTSWLSASQVEMIWVFDLDFTLVLAIWISVWFLVEEVDSLAGFAS